jgi:methyl-accepting chemotaxis protein
MGSETNQPIKQKSLVTKFNLSLLVIYLGSVLISAPSIYFLTKKEVYDRAQEELTLMVDVVKSIQDYVATDLRPHFMKEKIFYSPSFSGIVATARIAKYLKQKQPQYYIRNASDNPLNRDNLVHGLELDLLQQFRDDRSLDALNSDGVIDGRRYLVSSAPKISKQGCLRCHGDPAAAPKDVSDTYGTHSGYGYRNNEVVGVSLVGVPLANVQNLAMQRSLIVIGAITAVFTLLFVIVNLLVRRLILVPVLEITEVAKAVSKGDIHREISPGKGNDEIAELTNAFELMRRSLLTAMKRMKRSS